MSVETKYLYRCDTCQKVSEEPYRYNMVLAEKKKTTEENFLSHFTPYSLSDYYAYEGRGFCSITCGMEYMRVFLTKQEAEAAKPPEKKGLFGRKKK